MTWVKQRVGYTILEVLIVIAVSSVMFFFAVRTMGGRQQQVQFSQSVRDFASKIQDTANDVSTGYYTFNDALRCQLSTVSTPHSLDVVQRLPGDTGELGKSEDCVFIGKVVQLRPDGSAGDLMIYSMLGKRFQDGTITPTATLEEAKPVPAYVDTVGGAEPYELQFGVEVTNVGVLAVDGSLDESADTGAVGFFTSLTARTASSVNNNSQVVQYAPINMGLDESVADAVNFLKTITDNSSGALNNYVDTRYNEQLVICLRGGSRTAALLVGPDSSTNIQVDFDNIGATACR